MHNRDEEVALFWYHLIEPLVGPELSTAKRRQIIQSIIQSSYQIPGSRKSKVSEANLKKKLCLYGRYKFEGLRPKVRSDKGEIKALPADILQKALELKAELPSRSVRKII